MSILPPRDPALRPSRKLVGYLLAMVILSTVLAFTLIRVSPVSPVAAFTLQFWQWGAERALTRDELTDLAALPVDGICWWSGSIAMEGGSPRFHPRGGQLKGASQIPRWVVVRIEPSCNPLLGKDVAGLRQEVLLGLQRGSATGPIRGLQIDWDVPSRLLREYADFLKDLRHDLPATTNLSCTGLVTWLDAAHVDALVRAVDWWVPQCYSTDVPDDLARATALVCRVDPGAVAARCAQLGRPFRIGLPLFEQASLWNKAGKLLSAALPIACEDALAADFDAEVARDAAPAGERFIRFTAHRDLVIAGRMIPDGATLMIGEPTVSSLSMQIAAIRAQGGPWCRGVSLFRLSGAGELPCLSTTQVRTAWAPRVPNDSASTSTPIEAAVRWQWDGGPKAWRLTIVNAGVVDWMNLTKPLRLDINATLVPGSAPAQIRVLPALSGVPTGPAHATGSLVMIPFLRSGAQVNMTFSAHDVAPPTAVLMTDEDSP